MEKNIKMKIFVGIIVIAVLLIVVSVVMRIFSNDKIGSRRTPQKIDVTDWYGDGKHLPLVEEGYRLQVLNEKPDFDKAIALYKQQWGEIKNDPDTEENVNAKARVELLMGTSLMDDGRWNAKESNLIEGIGVLKGVALNEKYQNRVRTRAIVAIADVMSTGVSDDIAKKYVFTGKKFEDFINKGPAYNPVQGGYREMLVWASELEPHAIADFRVADYCMTELLYNKALGVKDRTILEKQYQEKMREGLGLLSESYRQYPVHRRIYLYGLLARAKAKEAVYTNGVSTDEIKDVDVYFDKSIMAAKGSVPKSHETRWLETISLFYQAQWFVETGRVDKAEKFFAHVVDPVYKEEFKRFCDAYKNGMEEENYIQHYRRGIVDLAKINSGFSYIFTQCSGWNEVEKTSLPDVNKSGKL